MSKWNWRIWFFFCFQCKLLFVFPGLTDVQFVPLRELYVGKTTNTFLGSFVFRTALTLGGVALISYRKHSSYWRDGRFASCRFVGGASTMPISRSKGALSGIWWLWRPFKYSKNTQCYLLLLWPLLPHGWTCCAFSDALLQTSVGTSWVPVAWSRVH